MNLTACVNLCSVIYLVDFISSRFYSILTLRLLGESPSDRYRLSCFVSSHVADVDGISSLRPACRGIQDQPARIFFSSTFSQSLAHSRPQQRFPLGICMDLNYNELKINRLSFVKVYSLARRIVCYWLCMV